MNEKLLIGLSLLIFVALPMMIYPLRKTKVKALLLAIGCFIAIVIGYWQWGGWSSWRQYLQQEAKQKKIQTLLQALKNPQEIIEKLKAHLQAHPKSARGWYLLGRLYASQNQWLLARDAFAKAMQLNSQNEAATLNYVQSLWQLNHQQFNEEIHRLVKALLQKNPQQGDALAMLAMDAFTRQDYPTAINYWQRLLALTPQQSEEAQIISKAIAKAQEKIKNLSE